MLGKAHELMIAFQLRRINQPIDEWTSYYTHLARQLLQSIHPVTLPEEF